MVISAGILNGISYFTFAVCHQLVYLLCSWEIDGHIGRACAGMRFAGHGWPWVSEIVIRKHGRLR